MATLESRIRAMETDHANPRSVYAYSDSELEAIVQRATPGVELNHEVLTELVTRQNEKGGHHEES